LLRIAAGLVQPDAGERFAQPGATIQYLSQEPDLSGFGTTLAYVEAGFADVEPARRWNDLRHFSAADQGYCAELLPEAEEVEFTGDTETREPGGGGGLAPVEILEESGGAGGRYGIYRRPTGRGAASAASEHGCARDQAAQEIRRLRTNRQDTRRGTPRLAQRARAE